MDTLEREKPAPLPAAPPAEPPDPARKTRSQRIRRLFIDLHLWVGLILGAWFALVGLTGSLLAFRGELLSAELTSRYPLRKPAAGAPRLTLSQAVSALRTAYPLLTERDLASVTVPNRNMPFYSVTRGGRRDRMVFLVDPYSGQVHRPYNPAGTFIGTVNQLHTRLLSGFRGYVVNGALSILGGFLLLSGLYVWWPPAMKHMKQLKARLTVKRGVSLNRTLYDLHNVLGMYLYPVLLLVTLTGPIIVAEHLIRDGVQGFWQSWNGVQAGGAGSREGRGPRGEGSRGEGSRGPREGRGEREGAAPAGPGGRGEAPAPKVTPQGRRLSDDEVVVLAREAKPGYELTRVRRPAAADEAFQLSYQRPLGISRMDTAFLDPYTGKLLQTPASVEGQRRQSPFMLWTRQLHFGEFGGWMSKTVYAVTGALPLGLFLTGLLLWVRKKISRSRRVQSSAPAASAIRPPEIRPESLNRTGARL